METLSIKTKIECENCHKNLSKAEVKPVVIGNGSVKRYCEECLVNLKLTIKKEKSAARKYRSNPFISWRGEILFGIVIAAIIGIIYLLYNLFT